MNQRDLCELIVRHRRGAPMVTSPGTPAYDLWQLDPDGGPTLNQMELSYTIPFCAGIAEGDPPLRVIAVCGDGDVIAGMHSLSTVGRYAHRLTGLVIVVIDNESYQACQDAAVPAAPSATATTLDLAGVALKCGITQACTVTTVQDAAAALAATLADNGGPWFIVAKTLERSPLPPIEPPDPWDRRGWKPNMYEEGALFLAAMRELIR